MKAEAIVILKSLSDFVVGAEGNVSARTENGFVIKPSGYSFNEIQEEDLVECYLDGTPIHHNKKPSMEVTFHSWLYSNYECNYIAHTHPTNTLKILCSETLTHIFTNKRLFPDQVIYNGDKSCLVPYTTPGKDLTNAIKLHVNKFRDNNFYFPKVILLQNHGIITTGKSIKECIYASQICEKSATILLGSYSAGHVNFLSQEDIEKLLTNKDEKHRLKLLCQK